MHDLMKGDRPIIVARLYEKGFWGSFNQIGECPLVACMIRNNVVEEKASRDRFSFEYTIAVNKPMKPLVTEIMHVTMKAAPAFKTSG